MEERVINTPAEYEAVCGELFQRACEILKMRGLSFRTMVNRRAPVKSVNNLTLGYTNLQSGAVTIDVYTPKKRQPKSIAGILRTMAHEIAHHQKKPYRQRYRGRWIIRYHYPAFYKRVNKNVEKFKKDAILGAHFI